MGYPSTGPQLKGLTRSVPTGLLGRGELDNFFVRYAVKDDRTRRNKIILRLLLYQALILEELETLRPPPNYERVRSPYLKPPPVLYVHWN